MSLEKKIKWFRVAPAGIFPQKEGRRVQYGDQVLALFNLGEEYLAIENKCPHKGGPLADGIVAGKNVFCPLHNWKINLENGCAMSGGAGQVKTFPVKIMDGEIYIAFEEGKFQECKNEIASLSPSLTARPPDLRSDRIGDRAGGTLFARNDNT